MTDRGGAPSDAIEHEVKLEVEVAFVMPALEGAEGASTVVALADQDLDAVYYDGPSAPLLHAGITVRRRTGEGTRWTVKFPEAEHPAGAPGSLTRREVEVVTDDEEVPAAVADLVAPDLGPERLEAVAHLRSRRRRWHLTTLDGERMAEVADDLVTAEVPGVGGSVTFREIEVEFDPSVAAAAIDAVIAVLIGAGARTGDPRSKLERSLALLGRW